MKQQMGWMVLGAALFGAGMWFGMSGLGDAEAQTVGRAMGMGDHDVLFTSSADGRTLYLWRLQPGHVVNPHIQPRIERSVDGDPGGVFEGQENRARERQERRQNVRDGVYGR